MEDHFNDQIKLSKKILRKKSHNYINNFKKIEKFIKKEIQELENLKNLSKPIIPDINFSDLNNKNNEIRENVMNRGCIIIRDVFEDKKIISLNKELESYIEDNRYYDDQKKKQV